jgi:hypothetical protein
MIHLRLLLESRPVEGRVPDQSLILTESGEGASHITAIRGDGYALVYLPGNISVKIRVNKLQAKQVKSWWYNPRTGKASEIGTFDGKQDRIYEVPVQGVDWVLVIDDLGKGYLEPAKKE